MKKTLFVLMLFVLTMNANAQYAEMDAILTYLESKKGPKEVPDAVLDHKRFLFVKDYEDHTERHFVILNGDKVTYVEMFDDKSSGETSSNVFTGDMLRSKKGVISIRCDVLEGQKIPVAVTKTFLPHQQRSIIYLVDMNTRERWIDEQSFSKKEEIKKATLPTRKSKKKKD